MADRSGQLPRMTEVDEDGRQWAEEAESPSNTGPGEEEKEEEGMGSPMWAPHIGTPPPLSPPVSMTGALTPTSQLGNETASPITAVHEDLRDAYLDS